MSAGISAALSMASPPVPAPRGRVALVSARVAGSAALWERDPEATSAALRMTTALLKRLLADHRGYEVHADGEEGILAAFRDVLSAARWCLDVQEALLDAEWSDSLLALPEVAPELGPEGRVMHRGLRVGMALHVGEPDAVADARSRRTTYVGEDVEWVKTVGAVVHGGQVLLTEAAWEALEEAGPQNLDADVTELGRHRFPLREEPASLVQILPWRVADRAFPAVQTQHNLATNLPPDPGVFLGRERLLSAVDRFFQKGRKLVTLKGHGGIGKTRLALRYAGTHLHEYGDSGGVWFCDLSGARSIDGVCHAIARALGIPLRARSLKGTQQLAVALHARGRCLLVLDNFEQVQQYADLTVGLWARKAPRLRVLVTSRHRLNVPGEALVEVTPLDSDHARELFLTKARETLPHLRMSAEDEDHVDTIVNRVQCVPLAVELAAAWVSMLSIEGIAKRLGKGHNALLGDGNAPDAHPRHATLREVMDASWELLTPWEQEALVSCAVFRGGFTAEDGAAVIDLARYRRAPGAWQVLQTLRDKSLLFTTEVAAGQVRWDLFDSVAEFAADHLVSMGLRSTLEQRHARTYLELARRELERVRGPEGAEALDLLGAEVENLLAAHERFVERHPQVSIQAALALDPVLATRGPFDLHVEVLDGAVAAGLNIKGSMQVPARVARVEVLVSRGRFLQASEAVAETLSILRAAEAPETRAWVQAVNAWVITRLGHMKDGISGLSASVKALTQHDHPHACVARYRLGLCLLETGQVDEAEKELRTAKSRAQQHVDRWLEEDVLVALGDLARHRGQPEQGRGRYQEALAIAREVGDKPRMARTLARLGSVSMDLRQSEAALAHLTEAGELASEVGDALQAALIQGNLGRLQHHEGRGKEAEEAYEEALVAFGEAGSMRWQGIFRGVLGALQHEQGRVEDARLNYKTARDQLEGCGDRRFAGLIWARLGALQADRGEASKAEHAFTIAQDHLDAVADPLGLAALAVHRGHLDLSRARSGSEDALRAARERFRAATTPGREGSTLTQPPAAISNDVRLALRLLRRSMELGSKE